MTTNSKINAPRPEVACAHGVQIRVRGTVQGVGFRPMVWRIARELGVVGDVANDAEGVLIRVSATAAFATLFATRIRKEAPPLARIESIEVRPATDLPVFDNFVIRSSATGVVTTSVAPDAAICACCLAEIFTPSERRYRYPFTNCTNCGPRLTIIERIPYDRGNTSMSRFAMCESCEREYRDSQDRRFHAEPIACTRCGPKARLVNGAALSSGVQGRDDVEKAAKLLDRGAIVAVKGIGGYQLACDALNSDAVTRLRERKLRVGKPFALMARDVEVVRRYATVSELETTTLSSVAAPIVLLEANGRERLPDAVAPGLSQLGFMLPSTPLHALLLSTFNQPLVMTSGNRSEEPQCIDDDEARKRLADIADHFLTHDRRIVNRVDDSVVSVSLGRPRSIRRARGYAPAPIQLPPGFEDAPSLTALGGELKSTFCLVKNGQAVLSQHQGDLEDAATWVDFERNLALFADLFAHAPTAIAVDLHPEYLATKHGRAWAAESSLNLVEVQHHHAHVAACMAENGVPRDAPAVLGIVLDGLGFGTDGEIWGGEFLLADYTEFQRLASLKPVAMPGGTQAVREPWRNLVAHLDAAFGPQWPGCLEGTQLGRYLTTKQTQTLSAMIHNNVNAPRASSCGRLFDAVAAALGVCPDRVSYEGEAAARLEALAGRGPANVSQDGGGYPFAIEHQTETGMLRLEPRPMWAVLLSDLRNQSEASTIVRRFSHGLATALATVARQVVEDAGKTPNDVVAALSGGCFQNRLLTEELARLLRSAGFSILLHAEVPPNDGGLALGQAAVAAARLLKS